jgi:hypothetical protein
MYLTVTICLPVFLFKDALEVKQPSASVNPDNHALDSVTFLSDSICKILVPYLWLKAYNHNLN